MFSIELLARVIDPDAFIDPKFFGHPSFGRMPSLTRASLEAIVTNHNHIVSSDGDLSPADEIITKALLAITDLGDHAAPEVVAHHMEFIHKAALALHAPSRNT